MQIHSLRPTSLGTLGLNISVFTELGRVRSRGLERLTEYVLKRANTHTEPINSDQCADLVLTTTATNLTILVFRSYAKRPAAP